MTDTDMLYMASLEKRNEELEAKVAELEDKHWNECRQIAHYSDELRRTKELLKKAVEDFNTLGIELDSNCELCGFRLGCEECPLHRAGINCRCWNKQDEALALIGEDANVPASADDTNVVHKSGGWISVNDRLPEAVEEDVNGKIAFSKSVLVYLVYDNGFTYITNDKCRVDSKSWLHEIPGEGCKVTHWMPLPEPPKDGEIE